MHEKKKTASLALSVIIPAYNEAENIGPIHARLTEVLTSAASPYASSYELIFVDDGSSDHSFAMAQKLQQQDLRLKVIKFRRNFGKTAALHAGFSLAKGQQIITIDADMQEDPADLFKLLAKLNEGYDLVSAWREQRHDPTSKTLPSQVFNRVVSQLTGLHLHDFNCGFKAYSSELKDDLQLRLYGELHRFIPVLAWQRGFKVTEIPVIHRPRRFGKSKFGSKRLLNGYLDFIQVLFLTTYLQRPLRLFGTIGTIFFGLGLLIGLHMFWLWLNHIGIGTRPLLSFGVLLLITGIQFISMGLVGEMLRNSAFRAGDEYSIQQTLASDSEE